MTYSSINHNSTGLEFQMCLDEKRFKFECKICFHFNKTVAVNIVGNDSLTEIESSKEIYATLSYEPCFLCLSEKNICA